MDQITKDKNLKFLYEEAEKTEKVGAGSFFRRLIDVLMDTEYRLKALETQGRYLFPLGYFLFEALKREYKRIQDILAIKTRTRCEHCGKITTINTEADIKKIVLLLRYVDTKRNQELNKMSKTRCSENWDHEFYLLRETKKIKIYVCKFCGEVITMEEKV